MCFDAPDQKAPPPSAPPPVDTGRLAVKGSETKKKSQRTSKRSSGRTQFRKDLSLDTGSQGSGLKI